MILGDVDKTDYYRPHRSCEGYVFTRVCESVHGGGEGCNPSMHCRWNPSNGGGACSRGCLLGEGGVEIPPPKQAATVADGTHPTGMHSF